MPHHRLRHDSYLEDPIQQYQSVMENHDPNVTYCCVPSGCHQEDDTLHTEDLTEAVRVACNNEHCQEGRFMHKICFEEWEENVLSFLRSTGRARSWSEKQRLQNLWTKKGYDLAYKACGCKCAKGHLRKDLDWTPPGQRVEKEDKKKKPRRKKNVKPSLTLNGNNAKPTAGTPAVPMMRMRSSSMSSTGSGSGSPPSPSGGGFYTSPSHTHPTGIVPTVNVVQKSNVRQLDRRERHGSGSIFCRRVNYGNFDLLPSHKRNHYHIKTEDEGSHGNDDTRSFLLSTLSQNKVNRFPCILCHNTMNVFDRYPLIEGTFFLSPRQHSKGCVLVKVDGRIQYLNGVCMGCLEGWNTSLKCRYCQTTWSGSELILGGMYSYDIFAATPCCPERLRCNHCHKMVILPERRLQFFSDYSHSVACPHCRLIDFHFVKSLSTYNRRERGD